MTIPQRVLITGAAGRVGREMRRHLRGVYPRLRLSDIAPLQREADGEEVDATDLTDLAAVLAMMEGVDAVVHLGGIAAERDWADLQAANILGTFNVFEAARMRRVQRVVYASSNHAIGFYERSQRIDHTAIPLPDSRYGVSKAVGESLGALYAHKHGIRVMSIRVGNFGPRPLEARHLSIWVSPRDLAQLVRIGLEHAELRHEVVYGVSGNRRSWWDNANARRLGYAPQDDAEAWAADLPPAAPPTAADDAIAERYQGGRYCTFP